ncbi:MAG TPA: MBL fold metallo-hydrolase [Candidatus Saccharimonadales bacterium]|nr:MBL fold metallo-hydrolase [Candidatus Saccharimonadales bacterium]
MNITKYEHACLVVEEQGKKLIIDPGVFTTSLQDFSNVVAVVVTHMHPDHLNPETLQKIVAANPDVQIFTTTEAAAQITNLPTTAVTGDDSTQVAPFTLEFFGAQHAEIHPAIPRIQNVGVMVNDTFYYGGDSYTTPQRPVQVLAAPTSAPWLRAAELIDYLRMVKPAQAFATHNALLSDIGHNMMNDIVKNTCAETDGVFTFLQPGDTLQVTANQQ